MDAPKLLLLAIVSVVSLGITSCVNNHGKTQEPNSASTKQSTTAPKSPDTAASREIGNRATGNGGTRYSGPGPEMADPNGTTKAGSGPPKTR